MPFISAFIGDLPAVHSKTEPIPDILRNPRHTDERFRRSVGGVTIFLANGLELVNGEVEGLDYEYSTADFKVIGEDKFNRASQAAKWHVRSKIENGHDFNGDESAFYYEHMLRRLFEERLPNGDFSLELHHIIAGVTLSMGQPYHVYGTTRNGIKLN